MHIIAISGFNIAIIGGLFATLFPRLPSPELLGWGRSNASWQPALKVDWRELDAHRAGYLCIFKI